MNVPIQQCSSATVYQAAPARRIALGLLLAIMYAISLPYCYYTVGEPRKAAIEKAQRLFDERWTEESMGSLDNEEDGGGDFGDSSGDSNIGFVENYDEDDFESDNDNSFEQDTSLFEEEDMDMGDESSDSQQQQHVRTIEVDEFGEAIDASMFGEFESSDTIFVKQEDIMRLKAPVAPSNGWFSSWFQTQEQKDAKKLSKEESEKWQKKFREKEGDDIILPPTYLPSAWACLCLFTTLTCHALFFLLCHWIVAFKAQSLFSSATEVTEGCHVLVKPPVNRGKAMLVPIVRSTKGRELKIEFQRQTYRYVTVNELRGNPRASEYPNGLWSLATCPISLPLRHYMDSRGVGSNEELETLLERWGPNHVSVQMPSFVQMLRDQLLSPLAMFQVFCAVLWLLDEYWSYTLWTLASVVIFEAVTVFQRSKTLTMLGGMAPRPTPVYVYRRNEWKLVTSKDLLPGDIVSISVSTSTESNVSPNAAATGAATTPTPAPAPTGPPRRKVDLVIPCDCLLLTGTAVVNEASLTGESVPQMKEGVCVALDSSSADSATNLDMNGENRVNVLFSGTSVITCDGSSTTNNTLPVPPDGGCAAYVLRTGFSSSQGTLMQMIEFSTQTVSGDSKDTGWALVMLLFFALCASGYILKEGLAKGEKTQHELLIKCVIIITSVVPRQLPMQMAMAVNMALMSLMKQGLFCTEPYRVPLAGKVSHCLFDKTGTLTTDQLVPVGVVPSDSPALQRQPEVLVDVNAPTPSPLVALNEPLGRAAVVLAACHSLVNVASAEGRDANGEIADNSTAGLVGDPIELAALRGIGWGWSPKTNTATPGDTVAIKKAIANCKASKVKKDDLVVKFQRGDYGDSFGIIPPTPNQVAETIKKLQFDALNLLSRIESLEKALSRMEKRAQRDVQICGTASVLQRHYFSSSLARMSVIAKCSGGEMGGEAGDHLYSLVKGSPEAIKALLAPGTIPDRYDTCYRMLAKRGLRVLALAFRRFSASDARKFENKTLTREEAEENLIFAGFIAFECKTRADSGVVVASLKESDHKVAMITGDSPLTSIHVARITGICSKRRPVAVLTSLDEIKGRGEVSSSSLSPSSGSHPYVWVLETENEEERTTPTITTKEFSITTVPEIASQYDLAVTEKDFLVIAGLLDLKTTDSDGDAEAALLKDNLWHYCSYFKVFARMSPRGKADIIRAIQKLDPKNHVLMCGDGGNDVGALKAASVGVALLAGHANANTTDKTVIAAAESVTSHDVDGESGTGTDTPSVAAEDMLNAHDAALKARQAQVEGLRKAHMKAFQDNFAKQQQVQLSKDMTELTEKGEYMKMFGAVKNQGFKLKQALDMENRRFMAMHGQVSLLLLLLML